MRGAFDVLDGEDVVALFTGVTRDIVEGFALGKQYFENVARLKF